MADDPSMTKATKEQFYAHVGPMNVHPRSEPEYCIWETPDRRVIGKTLPGYRSGGSKEYFLMLNGTGRAAQKSEESER